MNMRYQIYSDESGHERFRSVGILSAEKTNIDKLRDELEIILKNHGRRCIEFKKIAGDKEKEDSAKNFVSKGVEYCAANKIRIDVLSWDTQDRRHSIKGRDDNKNLQMMYYKILKCIQQRWRHDTLDWDFYPDEHSAIDWREIMEYLENTNLSKKNKIEDTLFGMIKNYHFPHFHAHSEAKSHEEPITQLIDIFTGFARYSFEKGKTFLNWRETERFQRQLKLFETSKEKLELSRGDLSKFKVLKTLDELCKKYRMGVSINEREHLYTFSPERPLNFWFYNPQHEFDKAPVRK
ncbi:hypothetical protein KsCSTR_45950 [Candidatus Kuenenia stuttgartiensis]|uniref:DUF3800 domain-containing protein n=1 Tax=Kuenenia stuttgartiensis TaxID=174633 RepID=A0A6G7GX86_KUEST|nr:hypothetical protein [Candidatus Kuenenia stuttgartiensis]MBE7545919.1 hypothetical protein [Planctomycetia bacterium]MCF6153308.1 hypothetical protein [Candidatus Kuenenia stuttgartiensis]QII13974.1 hypothetical protein KsCSTR_45950 [Candidatus Kuenenia stuttgartiensis]